MPRPGKSAQASDAYRRKTTKTPNPDNLSFFLRSFETGAAAWSRFDGGRLRSVA
jgi:hypothetical protein